MATPRPASAARLRPSGSPRGRIPQRRHSHAAAAFRPAAPPSGLAAGLESCRARQIAQNQQLIRQGRQLRPLSSSEGGRQVTRWRSSPPATVATHFVVESCADRRVAKGRLGRTALVAASAL
jgi:hypothetical protein